MLFGDQVVSDSSPWCHVSLLPSPALTLLLSATQCPPHGEPHTPQLLPQVEGRPSSLSLPTSVEELVPLCHSMLVTRVVPPCLGYFSNTTLSVCLVPSYHISFAMFVPQPCTTKILTKTTVMKQTSLCVEKKLFCLHAFCAFVQTDAISLKAFL